MQRESSDPRKWLESEYLLRRKKNPSYSLRAFSRLLDLPSGRISQLLSEKRPFTKKMGEKIAARLNYDPKRKHHFLTQIEESRKGKSSSSAVSNGYKILDMDLFQSIADPIHFNILSLVETDSFRADVKFIAKRLNCTTVEARSALDRLVRIGLLKELPGKNIELAQSPGLATTHDIQSAALRKAHKKILQQTIEEIDLVPIELRDITSITMAIDPTKLSQAKAKLKEMRRGLSDFLESGRKKEVYRLSIQLMPVSKEGK